MLSNRREEDSKSDNLSFINCSRIIRFLLRLSVSTCYALHLFTFFMHNGKMYLIGGKNMASIQCIRCKAGIHYHGEPEGIEYIFIKEEDWESITTTRFDSQNKQYVNGSSFPMLYQADTIESDFVDLIVKAWKCPECGTFMFFDEHGRVVKAYQEDECKGCEKQIDGFDHVVFDDYSWDVLTESAVANWKIPKQYSPTIHARLSDSSLILIRTGGEVINNYKRVVLPSEQ